MPAASHEAGTANPSNAGVATGTRKSSLHEGRGKALFIAGIAAIIVGGSMLPGLRLSQVAHELGHVYTAAIAGYEVEGIVLDPAGPAATYTSLDPLNHDPRDQIAGSVVLSAGTLGAAAFSAGMLLAVKVMRTGRLVVSGVAAGLAIAAFRHVPSDAQLGAIGTVDAYTGAYTRTYLLAIAVVLLVAALPGGSVTRAAAYLVAADVLFGLIDNLYELWLPSQRPTDADLAAALTSSPVTTWRGAWTVGAVLLVVGPFIAFARSPNGWLLQRFPHG